MPLSHLEPATRGAAATARAPQATRIFVTVGSDIPFNRLVRTVDEWAAANNRDDVFAQIGETSWVPHQIRYSQFLEPEEFRRCLMHATYVVAHAGMGTILSALQAEKPILVMPRRGHLGETRNDHQFATVQHLVSEGLIDAAIDERDLYQRLETLDTLANRQRISALASRELISAIQSFIHSI